MTVQPSRNVRPRPVHVHVSDHSGESEMEGLGEEGAVTGIGVGSVGDESQSDVETSERDGSDGDLEGENFEQQISNVSFAALKQAQDALSRKRKRGSDNTPVEDDKLEVLRERLRRIKEQKAATGVSIKSASTLNKAEADESGDERENASHSDSGSGPSEEDAPFSRTSKHAPTAQSSKYQVSRKRQVVHVPKRVVRDPRFDAMHQRSAHPGNSEKAYGFIRDYQKSEISELKEAAKKTKNEDDKEKLKRTVGRMENRLRAKEAKERQQDILRRHRKEERDRVQQGKTPYYLKQKDIKEKALVEKFSKMKSKDREKLVERRRKKEGQKEKRRMPDARRVPAL